jgi:hypothetical protein
LRELLEQFSHLLGSHADAGQAQDCSMAKPSTRTSTLQ